jgi:hypothetical protein
MLMANRVAQKEVCEHSEANFGEGGGRKERQMPLQYFLHLGIFLLLNCIMTNKKNKMKNLRFTGTIFASFKFYSFVN